jgi:hypothetical protein
MGESELKPSDSKSSQLNLFPSRQSSSSGLKIILCIINLSFSDLSAIIVTSSAELNKLLELDTRKAFGELLITILQLDFNEHDEESR